MVNWLKRVIGKEWEIKSAGGLTGDAFFAEQKNQRLFLKRNSSPFLAVLSAEGIVPKLIWTKRMENGDVITAQQWLDGRKLKPEEMRDDQVAQILQKIHQSSELLHMFMRLGKRPKTSDERYKKILADFQKHQLIFSYDEVRAALTYLGQLLPFAIDQSQVVCHCDLNHNNLMLTNKGDLYLIDWDNAMIADPVLDVGMVLKWYVPTSEWDTWLKQYGLTLTNELIKRMYWYLLLDALHYLNWHHLRNEPDKVKEQLSKLRELNDDIQTSILN